MAHHKVFFEILGNGSTHYICDTCQFEAIVDGDDLQMINIGESGIMHYFTEVHDNVTPFTISLSRVPVAEDCPHKPTLPQ